MTKSLLPVTNEVLKGLKTSKEESTFTVYKKQISAKTAEFNLDEKADINELLNIAEKVYNDLENVVAPVKIVL